MKKFPINLSSRITLLSICIFVLIAYFSIFSNTATADPPDNALYNKINANQQRAWLGGATIGKDAHAVWRRDHSTEGNGRETHGDDQPTYGPEKKAGEGYG